MLNNDVGNCVRTFNLKSLLALLILSVANGCQPPEEIKSIVVPLERSGVPVKLPTQNRMVVAVAERPDKTWFFKLTGTAIALSDTEPEWTEFLKQIKFDDQGIPKWTLPTGWQQRANRSNAPLANRLATIEINTKRREIVELVVSSLGPDFDRLSNVNRWRGQLGLPEIDASLLESEIGELQYSGGIFLMFDRTGEVPESPRLGSPPPSQTQNSTSQSGQAGRTLVDYRIPDGWQQDQNSTVSAVRLFKTTTEGDVVISVTELPANLIPWDESMENWIAETGADPLESVEKWVSMTQSAKAMGGEARRINLVDLAGAEKAVVVVQTQVGDKLWYCKLLGPNNHVKQILPDFESFVTSLTLK